jgi:putative endonuclease
MMWQRFLQFLRPRASSRSASPRTSGDASAKSAAGAAGEQAAADFLRARGWRIIARNWRSPRDRRDELDLVCRDGDVLVFVEVKTRAVTALVPGYHAVDARKKRVLRRAAAAYLRGLRSPPASFRLDVVEVATHADGRPPDLLLFENVPLFPKHFRR